MLHRHALLPSLRLTMSTSLLAVGFLIGITTASTTASVAAPSPEKNFPPPAGVVSSGCESLALGYAQAYSDYSNSLDELNDAWEALYQCQNGGGQYAPNAEKMGDLAAMPSVIETR